VRSEILTPTGPGRPLRGIAERRTYLMAWYRCGDVAQRKMLDEQGCEAATFAELHLRFMSRDRDACEWIGVPRRELKGRLRRLQGLLRKPAEDPKAAEFKAAAYALALDDLEWLSGLTRLATAERNSPRVSP